MEGIGRGTVTHTLYRALRHGFDIQQGAWPTAAYLHVEETSAWLAQEKWLKPMLLILTFSAVNLTARIAFLLLPAGWIR